MFCFSCGIIENVWVRVLVLLMFFLSSLGLAQPAPIALVPLDSRPANTSLPIAIAASGNLQMVTPPPELLGTPSRATDALAIRTWLDGVQPSALIVSLDALAYGGLVQSRSSQISADEAWDHLWSAWFWHLSSPVYGFVVIPRAPDAVDRARNLEVIRRALDWAQDGTLRKLFVTWDDALSGSPAPLEGAEIRAEASARGLSNVFVHPGADEVASALTASLLLERQNAKPRVRFRFSNPESAKNLFAQYEGQTLVQSVHDQALGIGLEPNENADLELYVFNGGDPRTAALEIVADQRQRLVAVADVERVNQANPKLTQDLLTTGAFAKLAGFAAWGTPGNNIGTALAQAANVALTGSNDASQLLLAREYVNDVLYSSQLRASLRRGQTEEEFASPDARLALLAELRQKLLGFRLQGSRFKILDAFFPWSRSFEIGFELQLRQSNSGCPPVCLVP
jgi:hypothetical protein